MANPTYTLIQSVTLTTPTAAVTLGNGGTIPQTYTDLKVVMSLRNNRSSFDRSAVTMRINGDTGNNYSSKTVYAADGSAGSDSNSPQSYAILGNANSTNANANTFSPFTLDILNYAGSNAKSFSVEYAQESTTSSWVLQMVAGLWNQTSAITSITINDLVVGSSFVANSTFYLYGIKNS